ncbi:MAG: RDD family protein [Acholeplasmataceae bacterium]
MVPSFEKRVRAFAIDTSGVMLVGIVATFGVTPFNETLGIILFGLGAFMFYIFPYFRGTGQTFGKRIQKIKVVMKDDRPAPIWLLLIRDMTKLFASLFTYGLYLVVATFSMNSHVSRTIHDYIFQTKVIDLQNERDMGSVLGKSSLLKDRGI